MAAKGAGALALELYCQSHPLKVLGSVAPRTSMQSYAGMSYPRDHVEQFLGISHGVSSDMAGLISKLTWNHLRG